MGVAQTEIGNAPTVYGLSGTAQYANAISSAVKAAATVSGITRSNSFASHTITIESGAATPAAAGLSGTFVAAMRLSSDGNVDVVIVSLLEPGALRQISLVAPKHNR
jgi:hypothetical protein